MSRPTCLIPLGSVSCLGGLAAPCEGVRLQSIIGASEDCCKLLNCCFHLGWALFFIHLAAHRSGFLISGVDDVQPQPACTFELRRCEPVEENAFDFVVEREVVGCDGDRGKRLHTTNPRAYDPEHNVLDVVVLQGSRRSCPFIQQELKTQVSRIQETNAKAQKRPKKRAHNGERHVYGARPGKRDDRRKGTATAQRSCKFALSVSFD